MKKLFIVLLTLFTLKLTAQELFFTPSKAFQNISSLETYHVFQDSKGKIWVCTDGGVSCYDGSKVTSYTTEDGLVENVVFRGCEDRKGRIWFLSLSGFFCYFENGKFHSIAANKVLNKYSQKACNNFFFIGENDTLFCGPIATCGLIKIPPQNNYGKIILINDLHKPFGRFIVTNKINPRESVMGSYGIPLIFVKPSPEYYERASRSFFLNWNGKDMIIPFRFKKLRENKEEFQPTKWALQVIPEIPYIFQPGQSW